MSPDYTIVFDGGCSGNPGPMYGSYQITTRDGRRRIQRCHFGPGTSNRAEYLALKTAVADIAARCQKANQNTNRFKLHIIGDSKLIIKQVNGEWGCHDEKLRELLAQVNFLLTKFKEFQIEWKPREHIVKILGH